MQSAPNIGFEYRPSRWPPLALLGVGLLALVAIELCGLPALAQWVLAGAVIVHVAVSVRHAARYEVHAVSWRTDGGWSLRLVDDSDVEARLEGMRMTAGAIVLRLAWEPCGREALVLLPDNLDADTRRRLRMRLSAMPDSN